MYVYTIYIYIYILLESRLGLVKPYLVKPYLGPQGCGLFKIGPYPTLGLSYKNKSPCFTGFCGPGPLIEGPD